MRLLPLVGEFRKHYEYSNFGYTEGAIAASKECTSGGRILPGSASLNHWE